MKERPILFSAPMVNAILAGRKTQTRRIVRPLPSWQVHTVCKPSGAADPWAVWFHFPETDRVGHLRECPHGKPGDRLWVRETWTGTWIGISPYTAVHLHYAADGAERTAPEAPTEYVVPKAAAKVGKWVTPLFLPRWASRITLEITDVRVERLQEISEEDAVAEGVERVGGRFKGYMKLITGEEYDPALATTSFSQLWESINGEGSWEKNPWTWCISFLRITS